MKSSKTCSRGRVAPRLDGEGAQAVRKVHHHLREEEKKFFQVSGKILSDTQKTSSPAVPQGLSADAQVLAER